MERKKVLIVGAGASGLMAAIMAARQGAVVTVLEQNEKPGKKIYSTGNGRCNFTNRIMIKEAFRGAPYSFINKTFQEFSPENTLKYFEQIGILPVEREGCLYPRSLQAGSIVDVLLMEATRYNVRIKTNTRVNRISYLKKPSSDGCRWNIEVDGWTYQSHSLILANGSKASRISGSDGSGYEFAASLGHKIIKPLPALTALKCKDNVFASCAGVRTEGEIHLLIDQKLVISERGELQLTDYGISGIPVFQISRYAVRALNEHKEVRLEVDFFPEMNDNGFNKFMSVRKDSRTYQSDKDLLCGLFPEKLIRLICKKKNPMQWIKHFPLTVTGYMDYDFAQVCSGGVDSREIHPETMESKLCPSLFFCGELIDVDGMCGGYNLQWAWSSGAVAGKHAAMTKSKERNNRS